MSLRKYFKRLGRKTAKVHVQVGRVLTPVASAAAGFVGGPVAAAAVTGLGAEANRYFRATQARYEGQQPRARALGRGERKRVWTYGAIAGGAGSLGAGVTALATGSTFGQALGATFLGQGGSQLVGIGGGGNVFASPTEKALAAGQGPFGALNPAVSGMQLADVGPSGFVTAGNLMSQPSSAVPGIMTSLGNTSAAAIGGGGSTLGDLGTLALGTLNVGSKVLGNYMNPTPGTIQDGNSKFVTQDALNDVMNGLFGGGGGDNGGESDRRRGNISDSGDGGLLPILLIGGLLLAAS